MIFTDGTHLVSDESIEELTAFALEIGMREDWLQKNTKHPHYDLKGRMRNAARRAGAIPVRPRGVVMACALMSEGAHCRWTREDVLALRTG